MPEVENVWSTVWGYMTVAPSVTRRLPPSEPRDLVEESLAFLVFTSVRRRTWQPDDVNSACLGRVPNSNPDSHGERPTGGGFASV